MNGDFSYQDRMDLFAILTDMDKDDASLFGVVLHLFLIKKQVSMRTLAVLLGYQGPGAISNWKKRRGGRAGVPDQPETVSRIGKLLSLTTFEYDVLCEAYDLEVASVYLVPNHKARHENLLFRRDELKKGIQSALAVS